MEMFEHSVPKLFDHGALITLSGIPPHGCRVLRVAPWTGRTAVLAGTDLHLSGGGVEIASFHADANAAHGVVETGWPVNVRLVIAFPAPDGMTSASTIVPPGHRRFHLERG